ncbi:FAD/NAD(P)-binding domain-containing protein [Pholiota conissans]|uniref:FAD/NAD(P)-binding domain-containing protein n=1 Tax=Pholiota conissans TaxID=109636 RepID=A0A9P5Z9N1_9AGAR|nr:FAD/NAD(P)-binding domain-containing protein [Pholiota conissans]
MDTPPQLRLAIIGGGIGGLSLASCLSHLKVDEQIQIDVYEAAPKMIQVGAGISLCPRGWEILKQLGLEDGLAAYMNPGQELPSHKNPRIAWCYKKSDNAENEVLISNLLFPGGFTTLYRTDIQQVLLAHISLRVRIHLNMRLVSHCESRNEVQLQFQNGETATCDLLVGADGINSVVRKGLLAKAHNLSNEQATEAARPLWTGTFVYRSLIKSNVIKREFPNHSGLTKPMMYCGKNKHVVSCPVSQGKLINILAFVSDPEKESTVLNGPAVINPTSDVVSSFFANWSKEVKCITDNMVKPSRWAIEIVKPLEKYAIGRVAILGDAAHAMPMHLGNGAGQAIEDAYILANILAKAAKQGSIDAEKTTSIYSAIRQPFGNFAANVSVLQGHYYEFSTPDFNDVAEGNVVSAGRLSTLEKKIADGWEWTWNSSIGGDLQRAMAMI